MPSNNGTAGRSFWSDRTVLVTGAGGFVGSWLTAGLVRSGARVVAILRDSPGEALLRKQGVLSEVTVLQGSITDYRLVERALNEYEVDSCFHLAAQAIVSAANRSPISTFEANIQGTWTLLEACRLTPAVKRIVVASSDKAYGDQPILPYTEDTSLYGRYPYDASKVCTDVLARCYAGTYDLPIAVARCANIYGGADLNWSRLIPGTIRSVLLDEEPIIRSDGTPERDYLYVTDAVRAYMTLGARSADADTRGRAFNFGSGTPISALDLVARILAVAASSLRPRILGEAKGEIDRQYLDSSFARDVLGWKPEVSLDEGLPEALDWYADYLQAPRPLALTAGVR